jgi:hypothetical protein
MEGVAVRVALAAVFACVALSAPAAASAGYWSWGFNYLGNSTSSGDCLFWAQLGQVCSGWNYWYDNALDKRGGGIVTHGFLSSDKSAAVVRCCSGWWLIYPSTVGMGGYLKSYASYDSGEPSYLKVDSYA